MNGKGTVNKYFLNAICFFLTVMFSIQSSAQTFFDGTFLNSDWSETILPDTNNPLNIATVTQMPVGGNPTFYRKTKHEYFKLSGSNPPKSRIVVAHLNANAIYDQSTAQNAITSIDFSSDIGLYLGQDLGQGSTVGLAVSYRYILRQNNTFYRDLPDSLVSSTTSFFPYIRTNLTENDFVKIADTGPGPDLPDFSCDASPIQFGYATSNSAGSPTQDNLVTESGIDNWQVDLTTAPCSPPVPVPTLSQYGLLLLISLMLIASWRRRIWQRN